MRNTHPSGPPAVVASLLFLVIAYFGSYLALASKNVRPDNSFHVTYPLDVACCHYFYYPAHIFDTYARRDLWRGEFYLLTLFPHYEIFGREHHLGGDRFQTFEVLLERKYRQR